MNTGLVFIQVHIADLYTKNVHQLSNPSFVAMCVSCGADIFIGQYSEILSRVTRLGEFSLIGPLFTVGTVLKITEVEQIFGLLFPRYRNVLILTKKCLGYILVDFMTKSSGHPDSQPRSWSVRSLEAVSCETNHQLTPIYFFSFLR
jgi:hypothetical protein